MCGIILQKHFAFLVFHTVNYNGDIFLVLIIQPPDTPRLHHMPPCHSNTFLVLLSLALCPQLHFYQAGCLQ